MSTTPDLSSIFSSASLARQARGREDNRKLQPFSTAAIGIVVATAALSLIPQASQNKPLLFSAIGVLTIVATTAVIAHLVLFIPQIKVDRISRALENLGNTLPDGDPTQELAARTACAVPHLRPRDAIPAVETILDSVHDAHGSLDDKPTASQAIHELHVLCGHRG